MSYLLTTDVVIEAKRREPNTKVLAWLSEQLLSSVYLLVVTLGELQEGVAVLDNIREARALGRLEELTETFAGRILDITRHIRLYEVVEYERIDCTALSAHAARRTFPSSVRVSSEVKS